MFLSVQQGGKSMDRSQKLDKYKRRLLLLSILGIPFYAAFALGSAAHFNGNAMIAVLENSDVAFYTLVVGAIGGAIDLGFGMVTAFKIRRLEDSTA